VEPEATKKLSARDAGLNSGDDPFGSQKQHRLQNAHEMVGGRRVDDRHAGFFCANAPSPNDRRIFPDGRY
jgi:hypothetical protein